MIKDASFFVRIKKIDFKNFRNISSGTIVFPNSKADEFLEGAPSIIGLYGQNGSGKSSVIMALGILKDVLSGQSLNDEYASSIRYGCDSCNLKFSFAMKLAFPCKVEKLLVVSLTCLGTSSKPEV